MRACKILAITECLILVLTYTARYDSLWLPAVYGCQRDITYSGTSASSDPIYPAILPDSEIWLSVRYGYLRDFASDAILLPASYGYPVDIATCEILLTVRYTPVIC